MEVNQLDVKKSAEELETIFYFLTKGETRPLKNSVQKKICDRFSCVTGVNFYGMRSGPEVQDTQKLAQEIDGLIPEQVNFFLLDGSGEVSLLSQNQRDDFVRALRAGTKQQESYALAVEVCERLKDDPESQVEYL